MASSFQSIIYQLSTKEDDLVFLPHSKQPHIFLPSFSLWGYLQLRSNHDLVFTLSWQESAIDSHTMKYTLDSLSLPTQLHRNYYENVYIYIYIYIYDLITVSLYVLMTQNNVFILWINFQVTSKDSLQQTMLQGASSYRSAAVGGILQGYTQGDLLSHRTCGSSTPQNPDKLLSTVADPT